VSPLISTVELPILTTHFARNPPQLTPTCRNRFILDLKQAVVSRDGNDGLKAFAALGKKKEDMLWSAIVKNDSDAFWGMACSIVCPSMKSVLPHPELFECEP
jgi:hypothetical protein